MLHRVQEGTGERVVMVHGFTQTLRSWDPVATALAARRQLVRVDLPGHGGSADLRLGFAETAAALAEAGGPASYVGYSMGGRLALRVALDHPDLATALVLIGASPGLADPAERAARRRADHRLAATLEREGTDAFLQRWLAQPLFATLRPAPADLAARRGNPPEGLAAALHALGTGAQDPLWDRLGGVRSPVLLVAGAEDAKFSALARAMARAIGPSAEVALVPGAGHAVHLERPAEVASLLEEFLDAQPAGDPHAV